MRAETYMLAWAQVPQRVNSHFTLAVYGYKGEA
jgi:hypothetical protein